MRAPSLGNHRRFIRNALLLLGGVLPWHTDWAGAFDSTYSQVNSRACRTIEKSRVEGQIYGTTQLCRGRYGYAVLVHDEDDRQMVSFGRTAAEARNQPAAQQGFAAFTEVGPTIEWRIDGGSAFATIQRWYVRLGGSTANVLVVTRLPPGPVCHVAYIDAGANRNANVLARRAADALAPTFRCGRDAPTTYGEVGSVLRSILPAEPRLRDGSRSSLASSR